MATYSSKSVLGGTSYRRYPDPLVSGGANEDGLYPWSAFRARLAASITDGEIVYLTDYPKSSAFVFLFFTSDIPAVARLTVQINGSPAVGLNGYISPFVKVPFFDASAGGANVNVPAGKVGFGYVAAGGPAPNDNIYTSGFPATATALRSAVDEFTDAVVFANAPDLCSPISLQNWDTAVAASASVSGALPIILAYTSYTQAIRDAGNLYVAPSGATKGVNYQVVGLYSIS
jgi:hypothetical protein